MLTKDIVTIGVEWRFGADWPGQRCGAKTRKGTECQRPANKRNGRCRVHGGASTGPKTDAGRAMVGVFVAKFTDGVRCAVTGAGDDGVFRCEEVESALSSDFSASAFDGVTVSSDGLMGDIHASSEYRASLIVEMAKRAVSSC